jgi:hypothetical protein
MKLMWDDPIVEETRKRREEYAAEFDYDLEAMFRDLLEHERASGRRVASFPPRRPEKDAPHAA